MASELPSISVVVIGRNEGERLIRCLQSVREADYPKDKIELIYVDSNSTDGSCQAATKLGAMVIRINPDRPTAAAGRNAGFRQARFGLVQFLDGDTILNRAWFKKAVRALDDPNVACVFGRREEIAPHATIYNFWMHHDWYVAPGPANHCAGDALFRRDVLLKEEGFDESLIAGEEPDLCFRIRDRLGLSILCLDEPLTLHDVNMTRFREYWLRCLRTGHAYAEVAQRYPNFVAWRHARWRSIYHLFAVILAVALSVATFSLWPIAAWLVLLSVAILRNTWRSRARVGSIGAALLYSSHLYLAKIPIAAGQCDYWLRRLIGHRPRALVEYRT